MKKILRMIDNGMGIIKTYESGNNLKRKKNSDSMNRFYSFHDETQ